SRGVLEPESNSKTNLPARGRVCRTVSRKASRKHPIESSIVTTNPDQIPLRDALRGAADVLAGAGVVDPVVDAELLLAWTLGPDVSRGEVQAGIIRGSALTPEQHETYRALIARRQVREPLQHITGSAPFRHMMLSVGPGVFVPRPETEMVAQFTIDALVNAAEPAPIAVDLGTGSGAIALAMATEVPHAKVLAVDKPEHAILWARLNLELIAPEVNSRPYALARAFDVLIAW